MLIGWSTIRRTRLSSFQLAVIRVGDIHSTSDVAVQQRRLGGGVVRDDREADLVNERPLRSGIASGSPPRLA